MWILMLIFHIMAMPGAGTKYDQNLPKKKSLTLHVRNEYQIMTYNVWGLPIYLPGHDDDLRFPGMADSLLVRKPDILCLQEIFSVHFRSLNLDKLKESYHYHSDYDCSQSIIPFVYKDCHGGLATFSRFPIEEEFFIPFPPKSGMRWEEKIGAKGFLMSKIDMPHGKIWVVNTHMYSGPTQRDENIRMWQIQCIMRALDTLETTHPVLLAGDFNIAHPKLSNDKMVFPNEVYAYINEQMHFSDAVASYSSAQQLYTIDPETNKYCDSGEGNQKLDYIFYKQGKDRCVNVIDNRVEMKGVATLSDHHAFLTHFTLE